MMAERTVDISKPGLAGNKNAQTQVYISIGNSDGKLAAEEWQQFRDLTHELLTEIGVTSAVHGA